jgi:exosortase A-associated hydrolase 1
MTDLKKDSAASHTEVPLLIDLEDQAQGQDCAPMLGICSLPAEPAEAAACGVLILVGGPQYRAGSHRQFILLARALAARGYAVMRFDFSGMGDSPGPDRGFAGRNHEVRAAIDAFMRQVPALRRVVLWGLCDAASAALFYAAADGKNEQQDERVAGLTLLNPWVRSAAGLAKTHLKHYYGARLRDPEFWRKLFSGRMNLWRAVGGWFGALQRSRGADDPSNRTHGLSFQQRMALGWRQFPGAIQLIISGDDLTAREFLDHAATDAAWLGLLEQPHVLRRNFVEADHTFSSAAWRDQVACWTADWLDTLEADRRIVTGPKA